MRENALIFALVIGLGAVAAVVAACAECNPDAEAQRRQAGGGLGRLIDAFRRRTAMRRRQPLPN